MNGSKNLALINENENEKIEWSRIEIEIFKEFFIRLVDFTFQISRLF